MNSKNSGNYKKNFYIENLGCAKNQVDAETIIALLGNSGWAYTSADKADMIIINSCGFINPAKEESINTLISFRQQYPEKKIVLAGCLAQRYGKELAASLTEADAIFGNKALDEITDVADDFMSGAKKIHIPLGISSGVREGVPKGMREGVPEGMREGVPEGMREGMREGVPKGMREGMPKGMPEEIPKEKRQEEYRHGEKGVLKKSERVSLSFPGSVYVKIAEGCDNNCTYCAIPLIRGKLKSRDSKEIIDEIKEIIEQGFFEINLVAQDIASYGNDYDNGNGNNVIRSKNKDNLISLLEKISGLNGKIWIRLLYMHPDRFDPAVLEIMKSDKRIIPYFDIPFQHASENILRKMGRKGNFSSHLKIIENIRTAIPESVIRSTFLLGFPGEKKKDYLLVKEFLKEASLNWAGFFSYSKEENTPAFNMGMPFNNFILSRITPKRVLKLQEYQTEITEQNLAGFEGKTLDILAEEEIPEEDIILGRGYMNAPDVDGTVIIHTGNIARKIKPGNVVKCKIIKRNNIDLEASPLSVY